MPGSVAVMAMVTGEPSSTGPSFETAVMVGVTLFTITSAVSVSVKPWVSVTMRPMVKVPSSNQVELGFTPVASSY